MSIESAADRAGRQQVVSMTGLSPVQVEVLVASPQTRKSCTHPSLPVKSMM